MSVDSTRLASNVTLMFSYTDNNLREKRKRLLNSKPFTCEIKVAHVMSLATFYLPSLSSLSISLSLLYCTSNSSSKWKWNQSTNKRTLCVFTFTWARTMGVRNQLSRVVTRLTGSLQCKMRLLSLNPVTHWRVIYCKGAIYYSFWLCKVRDATAILLHTMASMGI